MGFWLSEKPQPEPPMRRPVDHVAKRKRVAITKALVGNIKDRDAVLERKAAREAREAAIKLAKEQALHEARIKLETQRLEDERKAALERAAAKAAAKKAAKAAAKERWIAANAAMQKAFGAVSFNPSCWDEFSKANVIIAPSSQIEADAYAAMIASEVEKQKAAMLLISIPSKKRSRRPS